MPEHLVQAFVAAEDSSFFAHDGLNFFAIFRAMIANMKAGRKVQGGSTITQQVARSLLLTSEKTYTRKIKEAALARRMEKNLTKQEIIYLYLNQIYLGQGAYGVGAASDIYFRKPAKEMTVAEAALLAGLPQAPSRYSPIYNPSSAKARQKYVLTRMDEEGFLSSDDAEKYMAAPLHVYVRKNYKEEAPFYLETVRQMLVDKLGEVQVLDKGIKVFTGLDLAKQQEAQVQIQKSLRDLDKRQGFRGPLKNLATSEEIAEFLIASRNNLMDELSPIRIIQADGSIVDKGPLNLTGKNEKGETLPPLPDYVKIDQIVEGVVTNIDDEWGLATVRFAEGKGLINVETMEWARMPDPKKLSEGDKVTKPSQALKKGDVILVRPIAKTFQADRIDKKLADMKKNAGPKGKFARPASLPKFEEYAELFLEQEPNAQGSLISFDQSTQEVIALVGGYSFEKSEFNRALQAARQTGSSFKPIVYAAALDRNYTPATPILDAPVVFEEEAPVEEGQEEIDEKTITKWKPTNHGKNFSGEVLFRNALIDSMNIPTVKIIQDLGVNWVEQYARRLEIFSPLNKDFTLALGSSGVTLYEMTKAFAIIARLGKATSPILIHKVEDNAGQVIHETISLDDRFKKELAPLREDFEKRRQEYLAHAANNPPEPEASDNGGETTESGGDPKPIVKKDPSFFFSDPTQLISPQLAYLVTSLLQGAVEEGTGRAAKSLGRPTAGKTGTTNGYYDAWFVGYTADITTGVWVGFDDEKTLGVGEVGGKAALPIWLDYMKFAHEGVPVKSFKTPDGIVFANIDNKTGKLASANSEDVVRQAFIEGSEPQDISNQPGSSDEDKDFFKEDLSE
jgi:penicillin-binding protein 1A